MNVFLSILSTVFIFVGVCLLLMSLDRDVRREGTFLVFLCGGLAMLVLGGLVGTYRVVPTQHVGVSRSLITQELSPVQAEGVIRKPFFGTVHTFPASSNYEKCFSFKPALEGSYEVTTDVCFYIDAAGVDWANEIRLTGHLGAEEIFATWRNQTAVGVADVFRSYAPEGLTADPLAADGALNTTMLEWYESRGVPLNRVTLAYWDFTSAEVAAVFDQSIASRRKVNEQEALLEAARIQRSREIYEVETVRLVAEERQGVYDALGLSAKEAIEYQWILLFEQQERVPSTFIVNMSSNPIDPAIITD